MTIRLAGLLGVLALWPAYGASGSDLCEEVVMMLQAEVSEEVILEWLVDADVEASSLAAEDLIALKEAGASATLLKAVIERARLGAPPSPPGDTTAAESAASPPTARSTVEPPPGPPGPTASVRASAGAQTGAMVDVAISYFSRVEDPDPEWDLFVYVDGIPVTYVPPNGVMNRAARIEFTRLVPPGRHVLRVAQERHLRSRGRWRHETRVAMDAFVFDLLEGVPADLAVEFIERLMEYSDPLAFKLVQGAEVTDSGRLGGDAEFWPALCDDIEASVPTGQKPGRHAQARLEDCVAWSDWWQDVEAPPRTEVLDAMAAFDFRPVPEGS